MMAERYPGATFLGGQTITDATKKEDAQKMFDALGPTESIQVSSLKIRFMSEDMLPTSSQLIG